MRLQGLVCGALVVGAAMVSADEARACGACEDFTAQRSAFFAFRREPLPANTRLLIPGQGLDTDTVVVTGTFAGEAVDVPFGVVVGDDAAGSVFVDITWPFAGEGEVLINSNVGGHTYPIGARVDDEGPTAPNLDIAGGGLGSGCCQTVGANVNAGGAVDDDPAVTPLVVKLLLSSAAGERVVYLPYNQTQLALGTSLEGCLDNDPLAVEGEAVDVTASVFDWAGNESPTVQTTFTFALSTPGGCAPNETGAFPGCAQGTTQDAMLPVSASVLLLALRRRRRR